MGSGSVTHEYLKTKSEFMDVTQAQCQKLSLNIYPNGKTLLHKICMNLEMNKFIFFKIFGQEVKDLAKLDDKEMENLFAVPFLEDMVDWQSPLGILIGEQAEDSTVAEYYLKHYLNYMPFGHHGRVMVEVLQDLVNMDIPGLD